MKKIALSGLVIVLFGAYVAYQKIAGGSSVDVLPVSTQTSSSDQVPSTTTNPGATQSQGSSAYKDGSYTGSVADAFYGNIQVKATISGGRLVDVQFLQYPNDRHDSVEINTRAMPLLKQEAIRSQSAQVDMVSGATDTSHAFVESLGSALLKAKS